MATTNLFSQPGVQGGRVHRQRPARCAATRWPRRFDAIDLGVELGADGLRDVGRPRGRGGRGGQGRAAPRSTATPRPSTSAAPTSASAATTCVIALEPKPNEPRGDMLPAHRRPRAGLHQRARVARDGGPQPRVRPRDDVGPELHPRRGPGAVARASSSTSTSTRQRIGKFDQDFRFGSEGIRDAFYLVKLLEDSALAGHAPLRRPRLPHRGRRRRVGLRPRLHAHLPDPAPRRPAASATIAEIQEALAAAQVAELAEPTAPGGLGREALDGLRPAAPYDVERARRAGLRPRAARPAGDRAAARRALTSRRRCRWSPGSTRRRSPPRSRSATPTPATLVADGPGAAPADRRRPAASRTRRRGGRRSSDAVGRRPARPTSTAIAVAGQQHGMVVLDADGAVVRPAKLWNDTESAPDAGWLLEQLRRRRGRGRRRAAACRWRRSRSRSCRGCTAASPSRWDRLRRVLLPHDWLT